MMQRPFLKTIHVLFEHKHTNHLNLKNESQKRESRF